MIREERADDAEAIAELIERAFAKARHSDGTEALIVARLRAAGTLSVSLVNEIDATIVGHVAFSPVAIERVDRWFGLGPVAVAPQHQGAGIGAALIETGLERLRANGANGCVVLGDPHYYDRFGFRAVGGLVYPGAPAPYFQALAFSGMPPRGKVRYHPAFG